MKKQFVFISLLCFASIASIANVRLPNIIGSHMVLQQKSNVRLWGWSAPSESITINVSWDTTTYKVRAGNDAKWLATIKTPEAGGSYSIIIKGNNTIKLEDVLIMN